jgi:hypothetical protein
MDIAVMNKMDSMNSTDSYISIMCRSACTANNDKELSECLRFINDNRKGVKFEEYLSKHKIIVDNELFNKYTDIFVVQNFVSCINNSPHQLKWWSNDYHYTRVPHIYGYVPNYEIIGYYIDILKNNGFMPDAYNFLKYPDILNICEDIYIPEDSKEYIKQFLYRDVKNINKYKNIVRTLNNHDLCVLATLCDSDSLSKHTLKYMYSMYSNAIPNKMHLIAGICSKNTGIAEIRRLIDFYVSQGVKCEEYLLSFSMNNAKFHFSKLKSAISYGYDHGLFYDQESVCHMNKKHCNQEITVIKALKIPTLSYKTPDNIFIPDGAPDNTPDSTPYKNVKKAIKKAIKKVK